MIASRSTSQFEESLHGNNMKKELTFFENFDRGVNIGTLESTNHHIIKDEIKYLTLEEAQRDRIVH